MVGLDIQDEMGRHEVGHIDNSMKIPLNNGNGCRFEGQFTINKVLLLLILCIDTDDNICVQYVAMCSHIWILPVGLRPNSTTPTLLTRTGYVCKPYNYTISLNSAAIKCSGILDIITFLMQVHIR